MVLFAEIGVSLTKVSIICQLSLPSNSTNLKLTYTPTIVLRLLLFNDQRKIVTQNIGRFVIKSVFEWIHEKKNEYRQRILYGEFYLHVFRYFFNFVKFSNLLSRKKEWNHFYPSRRNNPVQTMIYDCDWFHEKNKWIMEICALLLFLQFFVKLTDLVLDLTKYF